MGGLEFIEHVGGGMVGKELEKGNWRMDGRERVGVVFRYWLDEDGLGRGIGLIWLWNQQLAYTTRIERLE